MGRHPPHSAQQQPEQQGAEVAARVAPLPEHAMWWDVGWRVACALSWGPTARKTLSQGDALVRWCGFRQAKCASYIEASKRARGQTLPEDELGSEEQQPREGLLEIPAGGPGQELADYPQILEGRAGNKSTLNVGSCVIK